MSIKYTRENRKEKEKVLPKTRVRKNTIKKKISFEGGTLISRYGRKDMVEWSRVLFCVLPVSDTEEKVSAYLRKQPFPLQ